MNQTIYRVTVLHQTKGAIWERLFLSSPTKAKVRDAIHADIEEWKYQARNACDSDYGDDFASDLIELVQVVENADSLAVGEESLVKVVKVAGIEIGTVVVSFVKARA